jgi:hypothetical protein
MTGEKRQVFVIKRKAGATWRAGGFRCHVWLSRGQGTAGDASSHPGYEAIVARSIQADSS